MQLEGRLESGWGYGTSIKAWRTHQTFTSSQEGDALVIDPSQKLDRSIHELTQELRHMIDIT